MARPWAVAAVAALPLHVLPDAQSGVVTDGHRLAAYRSAADAVTVLDTAAGTSWHLTIRAGCAPRDVSFGRLLLACDPYYALVVDARSGRVLGPPRDGDWLALGRYWLTGAIFNSRFEPVPYYQDWRNGRYRRDDGRLRDLDSPALRVARPPVPRLTSWFTGRSGNVVHVYVTRTGRVYRARIPGYDALASGILLSVTATARDVFVSADRRYYVAALRS